MTRRELIFLTVMAVGIASVWMWRVYSPEGTPAVAAEASAAYYPEDAVAYASVSLDATGGQLEYMTEIVEFFHEFDAVSEWVTHAETLLVDAMGTDFEGIGAWMGSEVSAAIFDLGDGRPGLALAVDITDRDAAGDFLARWIDRREADGSGSFERLAVSEGAIWLGDGPGRWMEEEVYALSADLMLFSTDRGLIGEVLDHASGGESRSLAANPTFLEARSAAPDQRFASAFLDYGRMRELIGDGVGDGGCSGTFRAPGWMMASAGWADGGLVLDLVMPDVTSWWTGTSGEATAGAVPAGSLGFVSVGFDPDLDRWRDVLDACDLGTLLPDGGFLGAPQMDGGPMLEEDATVADALDVVLAAVETGIGLDLEQDLFDHLGGELVVAVHPSDRQDAFIDGVALLSHRPLSGHALAEALDSLVAGIPMGVVAEEVDVGAGQPARIVEVGEQLSVGYMVNAGYLTLGTSVEALRSIADAQVAGRDLLADTDRYRRTVGHISYDPRLLAYVDLETIFDHVDPLDMGTSEGPIEVLTDGLSALALGVGTDGDHTRATLVLSLLPAG